MGRIVTGSAGEARLDNARAHQVAFLSVQIERACERIALSPARRDGRRAPGAVRRVLVDHRKLDSGHICPGRSRPAGIPGKGNPLWWPFSSVGMFWFGTLFDRTRSGSRVSILDWVFTEKGNHRVLPLPNVTSMAKRPLAQGR